MMIGDGLGDKANKHYQFQKKWLSNLKFIVVVIYFVVLPYLYTPSWCIRYFVDHQDERTSMWTYQCEEVRINGG